MSDDFPPAEEAYRWLQRLLGEAEERASQKPCGVGIRIKLGLKSGRTSESLPSVDPRAGSTEDPST